MQDLMTFAEQHLLPVALWLVMFGMGLGLVPGDFSRLAGHRRAFLGGAISMLVLVPVLGTVMALTLAPTPALAMGLILLATCPGGILSNLLTDLARGNVALSVTLSLFVSVVYIFTLPIITTVALNHVFGAAAIQAGQVVAVSSSQSFAKIVMVTLFPVSTGMALRAVARRLALAIEGRVKSVATTVLVIVFGMIVYQQRATLVESAGIVMAIVIAMNITNLGLALLISKALRLERGERVAIAMEHIIRQEATAIFVAVTLLHRNDMSLPMIINTFIGMAVGIPFVAWLRRRHAETQTAPA